MIAWLLGLFAIAWGFIEAFAFIVVIALCIPTMFAFDNRKYGWATLLMIAIFGVIVGSYWDPIQSLMTDFGTYQSIAALVGSYIVIGFGVTFFDRLSYCWKARENYDEMILKQSRDDVIGFLTKAGFGKNEITESLIDAAKRYLILSREALNEIFEDSSVVSAIYSHVDSLPSRWHVTFKDKSTDEALEFMTMKFSEVFPPRFKPAKSMLVCSGLIWPVTLLHLALFRVVNQMIQQLVNRSEKIYNAISAMAFGKSF